MTDSVLKYTRFAIESGLHTIQNGIYPAIISQIHTSEINLNPRNHRQVHTLIQRPLGELSAEKCRAIQLVPSR